MRINKYCWVLLLCTIFLQNLCADEPMYCPERSKYINIGMTTAQLLDACGKPTQTTELEQNATTKVQVTQLIFNSVNSKQAFYGVWSVRSGVDTGAQLEVDVIDNKIVAMKINGENINASNLCQNQIINVQDPVSKAINLCGSPSTTNQTYVNMPVRGNSKPQIWTYQASPYQPTMVFTIVDGKIVAMEKQ